LSAAFSQLPSIDTRNDADRSANAVASGGISAMAPPMWRTLSIVNGEGRAAAFVARSSIASSVRLSRYSDFQ